MPTPPYAKVLVSIAGGAPTSGFLTVAAGNNIQLSMQSSVGVQQVRWEIYDYPVGFSVPSGWAQDSVGVLYSTALTPPAFSIPAQGVNNWGKFPIRLRLNGNPLQFNSAGQQNQGFNQNLEDTSTILSFLDVNGVEGVGFGESIQGDILRSWGGAIMRALRKLAALVVAGINGLAGGVYVLTSDALSMSLVATTPLKVAFPHTSPVAQNTATSANGVEALVPGNVEIDARVGFVAPAGPLDITWTLYQNTTPIAEGVSDGDYTAGQDVSVSVLAMATAAANDVFYLYATSPSTVTLAVRNATLHVRSVGAKQGAQGAQGPAGSGTNYGGLVTASSTTMTVDSRTDFDTSLNAVALVMPSVATPGGYGQPVGASHVGGDVELGNGATLTDTNNNWQIQNPIDMALYTTITWGPGSGGDPNPNLPNYASVDWAPAVNHAGTVFWKVVAKSC